MEIIWEYLWWNRSLSYFLEWEYGLMVISMRWTFWYWMRIKGYNDDKITKVIRHMSHSYFDRLSQGIKPMSSPWRTGYDHRSWPISTRHLTLCQSPSFVLDGMILAEVILALQEVREYLQPHWPCHGLCGPDALAHVFCKFASSCIEVCFWWSWQKWDSTYCPPGLFLAYVGLTFLHMCSVSKSCSILLRSWLLVPVSQLCSWWHDLSWSNLGTRRSARVLTTHLALSWPMRAWRARTCVLQFCIILHWSLLLMILALQGVRQYLPFCTCVL